MKTTWVLGQAVVTLAAIGYGVSAHSSWDTERQRRIASERAAVTEMATAMKGVGDRIATIERELERCQSRNRRRARPAAETPTPSAAPAPETPRAGTTNELSTEEAFRVLAGPITWMPAARPAPAGAGRYEPARGTNVGRCPPAAP